MCAGGLEITGYQFVHCDNSKHGFVLATKLTDNNELAEYLKSGKCGFIMLDTLKTDTSPSLKELRTFYLFRFDEYARIKRDIGPSEGQEEPEIVLVSFCFK